MSAWTRRLLLGLVALGAAGALLHFRVSLKHLLIRIPIVDELAYSAREYGDELLRTKPSCRASAPPGDPPSVILLAVDSLRADRIAPYGDAATPQLERLAEDSVVYQWAFSAAPWTTPGFAGIFTGEHPRALGMAETATPVPRGVPTLATLLCEAGYRTEAVVSHTYVGRKYGFAAGFERWDQALARGHDFVSSRRVSDRAIERLTALRRDERPFLLFVHYFDPHYSYVEHPGFERERDYVGRVIEEDGSISDIRALRSLSDQRELDDADHAYLEALYDSEIEFTDHHIGRLLDELRRGGLYDEAIVVFVADHGEMLGRRSPMHWIGHTKYLWSSLTRVPLFVKLPGQARRERVAVPVSTVDLLPTLLDAVGAEVVAGGPPRSRSLLRDADALARPIFAQTRRWLRFDSVIRGRFKLIANADTGERALFDFAADPDERRDLRAEHPEAVAALSRELAEWVEETERRASGRAPAPAVELTPGEQQQLELLGYID